MGTMFVDYSGLQRFSSINKSFGNSYLHLLHYNGLETVEERLRELQKIEKTVEAVQALRPEDVKDCIKDVDFLFKLAISVQQMVNQYDVIKRCPTLYVTKFADDKDSQVDMALPMSNSDVLRQTRKELYSNFDKFRSPLLEEVKKLILDLRPSDAFEEFDQWHVLQKCLFYESCSNISKFIIPKIDIVIIPVCFPMEFINQVNNEGFIKGESNLNFMKFDLGLRSQSLESLRNDSLFLRGTKAKISTIWKDGDAEDFIGTMCEASSAFKKHVVSPEHCKRPGFASLFRELFPEMADIHIPPTPIANARSVRKSSQTSKLQTSTDFAEPLSASATENHSFYDIFSPLSSNNLPTAVTPADMEVAMAENLKVPYIRTKQKPAAVHTKCNMAFPAPPPSLLSPFEEFETHSGIDQHSLRGKLKSIITRAKHRNQSQRERRTCEFDTIGSFAEFQTQTWNEMTSKKFLKFKYKKFKRNCHYLRDIAKQCFEDLQDASSI